MTPNPRSK